MADAPQPINLGGLGDIDMYPIETQAAARLVHQAGKAFATVWDATVQHILDAEKMLGQGADELGKTFRASYNPFSSTVIPAARQIDPTYDGLAGAGSKAVVRYLEVDGQIIPDLFRKLE
ncbi:hypothetical protein [Kribbella sp. NPDC051620]|uniref:hypothetical protein n=1 Tax=Kribbella sp. NPDC051620 TaxID=3364120 RepID=UPI003793DB15